MAEVSGLERFIYNGYVEEIAPILKRDHFSCLFTSPRYNRNLAYPGVNDKTSDEDYLAEIANQFRLLRPAMRYDSFVFVNVGDNIKDPFKSHRVAQAILDLKGEDGKPLYHFRQRFVWAKSVSVPIDHKCPGCEHEWSDTQSRGQYTASSSDLSFAQFTEFIWALSPNPKLPFNRMAVGIPYQDTANVGRYSDVNLKAPGDLVFYPYETSAGGRKKPHVCPFPVDLVRHFIKISPPGPVLDPFAGSGTTLRAAQIENRPGVGIEQNLQFIEQGVRYHRHDALIIQRQDVDVETYKRISELIGESVSS